MTTPRRPARPQHLPLEIRAVQAARQALAVWGRKGARARAAALTPEERRAIARKATKARWATRKRWRQRP